MRMRHCLQFLLVVVFSASVSPSTASPAGLRTRNVILITTDGLRWQEVFRGAEEALMDKTNGGVKNVEALRKKFWRDTPEQRRAALLPFLWSTVASDGQIWGHTNRGSTVLIANDRKFSYPGYSELLTGVVDPAIDSNRKFPNPHTNVLEWLNAKRAFKGRCAVFASWDVFPFILNRERGGLHVRAGIEPLFPVKAGRKLSPRESLLNDLAAETTPPWDGILHDSLTWQGAKEYFLKEKPRVFYIAFDETDDWAHDGRYDRVLEAAHRADDYVRQLWELTQKLPDYRGRTTLLITTDHGRGSGLKDWRDHGAKTEGAEHIWLAALGPDTPPLGERANTSLIYQKQVAATVAAFLGEDFPKSIPAASAPINELIQPGTGPRK